MRRLLHHGYPRRSNSRKPLIPALRKESASLSVPSLTIVCCVRFLLSRNYETARPSADVLSYRPQLATNLGYSNSQQIKL